MSSPALSRHPAKRATAVRGLTLIELMVALAVLAVLASAAVPSLSAQLERRRLMSASAEVATTLQFARSHALVSGQPVGATVLREGERSCLIVHTGRSADCSCTATPVCGAPSHIERALVWTGTHGIQLQANVASLRYDPRTGTTSPTGTLRVTSRSGAVHHIVNLGGRVRSCSPAPALPGLAAC
jgi:type IV fimbrial biogenesis protein FimT